MGTTGREYGSGSLAVQIYGSIVGQNTIARTIEKIEA